ncbi:unnamed protein product [Rotaria socialis]|nr:unnamed protein product [Rotaria socialis]
MAVALNPEFARGYLRRAMSAMKLEKYDESLKAFEKYCEMEPDAKNDNAVSSNIAAVRKAIAQQMKAKKEKEKIIARINTLFQRGETESDEFTRISSNARENLDAEILRHLAGCCWNLSPFRTSHSALNNLLSTRFGSHATVSASALAEYDETILFVIEKMKKDKTRFLGTEIVPACGAKDGQNILPNPRIIEALLATNQMKINLPDRDGWTALFAAVRCANNWRTRALPPQLALCFQMILLQPSINIDLVLKMTCEPMWDWTPFATSYHPEVTQILLRAGANVHQLLKTPSGECWGVLELNVEGNRGDSPFAAENIRVLIEAGARLVANQKKNKLCAMLEIIGESGQKDTVIPPEVFDMIFQLVQHQKFELIVGTARGRYQLLFYMVHKRAPIWMLRKVLAAEPQAVHAKSKMDGVELPASVSLHDLIADVKDHAYFMEVLTFLLDAGVDLEARYTSGKYETKTFITLWNMMDSCCSECRMAQMRNPVWAKALSDKQALKLRFAAIIKERLGEESFKRLSEIEYPKFMADEYARQHPTKK